VPGLLALKEAALLPPTLLPEADEALLFAIKEPGLLLGTALLPTPSWPVSSTSANLACLTDFLGRGGESVGLSWAANAGKAKYKQSNGWSELYRGGGTERQMQAACFGLSVYKGESWTH